MKPRIQFPIFPMAGNPHRCTRQFNNFDHLVKEQIDDQKIKLKMSRDKESRDLLLKNHRISVLNRALVSIAVPIFIWLVLETFFK
jgi:hypothetical protein